MLVVIDATLLPGSGSAPALTALGSATPHRSQLTTSIGACAGSIMAMPELTNRTTTPGMCVRSKTITPELTGGMTIFGMPSDSWFSGW